MLLSPLAHHAARACARYLLLPGWGCGEVAETSPLPAPRAAVTAPHRRRVRCLATVSKREQVQDYIAAAGDDDICKNVAQMVLDVGGDKLALLDAYSKVLGPKAALLAVGRNASARELAKAGRVARLTRPRR